MLNEHVHKELAEIYDEFDRHSRITNTDYSIDADYPKLQGYTILKCTDFNGFLRHITNFVKNRPVDFRVNGSPVNYHALDSLPKKRHNLVTFAITPIQEEEMKKKKEKKPAEETEIMDENQYKFADTKHARDQNPRINSKMAHKRSAFEEANLSFQDRLDETLAEDISFAEPEILFTQTTHAVEAQTGEDEKEDLEGLKDALSAQIQKYMGILESTNNEITAAIAEDIIDSCTIRINQINEVLNA